MKIRTNVILLIFVGLMAATSSAQAVPPTNVTTSTVNYSYLGWYDADGSSSHSANSGVSYDVGSCNLAGPCTEFRNYFAFDLSGYTQITSARLQITNWMYESVDPSETFNLSSISTDINTLTTNTDLLTGQSIWSDLGTGQSYGSYVASSADSGSVIEINLSQSALDNINSSLGLFALGGSLSTLDGSPLTQELLFWQSDINYDTVTLTFDHIKVPEPRIFMLLLLGLLVMMTARKFNHIRYN